MSRPSSFHASEIAVRLILILGLVQAAPAAPKAGAPAPKSGSSGGRLVAVLDPVNLGSQAPSPGWGGSIRRILSGLPAWKVVPKDSMETKLREYRIDPAAPCHEFQCAFDAGNVLLSEFVLFATVTPVGPWHTYTLNLVHIPASQVVVSRAGEVRTGSGAHPGRALEGALHDLLSAIEPATLRTAKRAKKGLITVLELGPGLAASRVLADRLTTHLYGTRTFDIMTQHEQKELLAALEIDKSRFVPSDSSLQWLGGRMGVSHLLSSRLVPLVPASAGYRMGLALYDVSAGRKLREWPAQSQDDFRKLLLTEEKFFSGLSDLFDPAHDPEAVKAARSGRGWYPAATGLGMALAAAAAAGAWYADRDSDRQYALYRQALSNRSAAGYRERVEARDLEARALGGAALALLALSTLSLTLSF